MLENVRDTARLIADLRAGSDNASALAASERARSAVNAERAKNNPLFGWYWKRSAAKAWKMSERMSQLVGEFDAQIRLLAKAGLA